MKKTFSNLTFLFVFLTVFFMGRVVFDFIDGWIAGILAFVSMVLLFVCNYYERKIK